MGYLLRCIFHSELLNTTGLVLASLVVGGSGGLGGSELGCGGGKGGAAKEVAVTVELDVVGGG